MALLLAGCMGPSGGLNLTLGHPGAHVEASAYSSHTLGAHPALVVVLHGDAPILRPSYQDGFAARVARNSHDVVAVGLLRPGYIDPSGRRSDPQTGPSKGNNYTRQVTAQVAAAIQDLKNRYQPSRTILVGHSGGGAVVANMLEAVPGIADSALIASCPCDLAAWRARMAQFGRPGSHKDSLSPLENVASLPRDIPITVMVGARDNSVGVENSCTFYTAAKAVGAKVTLIVVPRAGHMMMGSPAALQAVQAFQAAP
jgi:pimeloyl-ACP methyl ester carboxylesterase